MKTSGFPKFIISLQQKISKKNVSRGSRQVTKMEKPTALAPRTKIVTSKRATLNSIADESIHVVHRIEVEEPG